MNLYLITVLFTDGEVYEHTLATDMEAAAVARSAARCGFNFLSITVECLS